MTGSKPLNIAIAVLRLTPAGGLEQHALRLANELIGRGHSVTLISTRAPAETPPGAEVRLIDARGRTNHGRLAAFARDAAAEAAGFDRRVSFHIVPGFDLIFCADPSRARPGRLRGLLPRYRTYADLEARALGPASRTRALCLSTAQMNAFARNNGTPPERLLLLPPTVDRLRAEPSSPSFRAASRAKFRVGDGPAWLWMGLQPRTKGLDRVLAALVAAPTARLLVCGMPADAKSAAKMRHMARRLGVADRVSWLGFLADGDMPAVMAAADLLVHPSRADVTGTVILEAMANGVPVITTAVCGYGEHVARAAAGVVIAEPFSQASLAAAVASATPQRLALWSANALAYTRDGALFSGIARAADFIEGPLP